MKNLPTVNKLIEMFHQLPGVGKKTAERYVFFLINKKNKNNILSFAQHLKELVCNIKNCHICGNITEQNICSFCSDITRDQSLLMIVSDIINLYYFERVKIYNGLYHILGGLVDLSRDVKPENLNLYSLTKRLKKIKEIIIATNTTFEGETTATYLQCFLAQHIDVNIKITRLAYGIPMGMDLNYLDVKTLLKAVENRNNFKGEKYNVK